MEAHADRADLDKNVDITVVTSAPWEDDVDKLNNILDDVFVGRQISVSYDKRPHNFTGWMGFVLHILHRPEIQVAEGYLAAKIVDATVGDGVKHVVQKLTSAGKMSIGSVFKRAKELRIGSGAYIVIAVPPDIMYELPEDNTEEALLSIIPDLEIRRSLPRLTIDDKQLKYENGKWVSSVVYVGGATPQDFETQSQSEDETTNQ